MIKWLSATALAKIFGDGFGADLAARGIVYLGDEVRDALDRDDLPVTTVKLQPGETYSVIARPAPTRRERKLASTDKAARARLHKASKPTRAQLRAARKLERAQKRLDRATPGSRRWRRRRAKERRLGERFDRLIAPSKKQSKRRQAAESAAAELRAERAANFDRARSKLSKKARRPSRRVYD